MKKNIGFVLIGLASLWASVGLAFAGTLPTLTARVGKQIEQAFADYEIENYAKALDRVREITPRSDYDQAFVAQFLGTLYWLVEEPKQAEISLRQAVELAVLPDKAQAETLTMLADILAYQARFSEAAPYYEAAITLRPPTTHSLYMRYAQSLYEAKRWQDVVTPIHQVMALTAQPYEPAYQLLLGSYFSLKQHSQAIKLLEQMISLFPDKGRYWRQLAYLYQQQGTQSKAIATLELAIKQGVLIKGRDYRQLAQLYIERQFPEKALRLLQRALMLSALEESDNLLRQLASLSVQAKEWQQAAKYYGQLSVSRPGFRLKQAEALLHTGKYQAAQHALQQTSFDQVDARRYRLLMAQSLFYLQRYESALVWLHQAHERNKEDATIRSWLALVKQKQELAAL